MVSATQSVWSVIPRGAWNELGQLVPRPAWNKELDALRRIME